MRKSILKTIDAVRPFVPGNQLKVMIAALRGEERGFFREAFPALEKTVCTMPVTYGQDGLGDDAVVNLHYFLGGADWWITEKDVEGGIDQAFGLVDLGHANGFEPELGYISIRELLSMPGVNVDLHWKPQTLAQVKAAKYKQPEPAPVEAAKPEPVPLAIAQVVNIKDWFADKPAGLVH